MHAFAIAADRALAVYDAVLQKVVVEASVGGLRAFAEFYKKYGCCVIAMYVAGRLCRGVGCQAQHINQYLTSLYASVNSIVDEVLHGGLLT